MSTGDLLQTLFNRQAYSSQKCQIAVYISLFSFHNRATRSSLLWESEERLSLKGVRRISYINQILILGRCTIIVSNNNLFPGWKVLILICYICKQRVNQVSQADIIFGILIYCDIPTFHLCHTLTKTEDKSLKILIWETCEEVGIPECRPVFRLQLKPV